VKLEGTSTPRASPVCLVFLVHLVYLVGLVQPNKQDKPNKRDRPNRLNRPNEQDRLADCFSILLEHTTTLSPLTTMPAPCKQMLSKGNRP
jgi:hypothetical protein